MALVSAEQLLLLKIHCPRAIGLPKNSSNPIFPQLNKKTKTIFPFATLAESEERTEVKSIAFKRGVLTLTRHLTNYQRHLQSTREFQNLLLILNVLIFNSKGCAPTSHKSSGTTSQKVVELPTRICLRISHTSRFIVSSEKFNFLVGLNFKYFL